METIINPNISQWSELCQRAAQAEGGVTARVEKILQRVKDGGDKALREIAQEIDGISLDRFEVSKAEIAEASGRAPLELKDAISKAASNIEAFHRAQLPHEVEVGTCSGVRCIQRPTPISKVGLYIPGGTAPLFSTVLMLAIPARLAGCREVVLCTPCGKNGKVNPAVLYAASYCGVHRIFRIGGAQAIAAMAYGTESIPAVNKIFGPGNRYVTTAKQLVASSRCAIDMPAGPSEVMVLADESASATFVAADLLSQAEHGADSQAMLVCSNEDIAREVEAEVLRQRTLLPRADYIDSSLSKSRLIVLSDLNQMIDFANEYAPEHLIISMKDPWTVARKITAAGSIFIGNYSPESAGDYASGTNHTLPTSGWAKSYSGVNIDSYMRKMTLQELSPEGLKALAPTIIQMANSEGLHAHAAAVSVRLPKN